MSEDRLSCSFCGLNKLQTKILVAGQDAHICDQCIEQAFSILNHQNKSNESSFNIEKSELINPKEIKQYLDDYVIGQDYSKKVISVCVYNHYKRINQKISDDNIEIEKSNVIMVGPTGTGKTLIAKTISKMLDVPLAIVEATVLTESGYVGEDVENILTRLLQASDYNIEKAEKGIIFIDEIDKISRKNDNPSITRDVSGEGVQQALLKIMEGTVASVPPQGGRKHPQQEFLQVDTTNILFICGGAFDGLEKIIGNRGTERSLGFGAEVKDKDTRRTGEILKDLQPEDLLKFGLIPEFVGRLPVWASLEDLDEESLVRILTEPKNALIKQYKKLFDMENVELKFSDDALSSIAKKTMSYATGARGLRSVIESILLDTMFEIPSTKGVTEVAISGEVVDGEAKPLYIYGENKDEKEKSVS